MPSSHTSEYEIVPCCEFLRTKMQHCAAEDMRAGPGFVRVTDTATYWCDKTAESFGPDDQPGAPELCQPGRACYQRGL